MASHLGPPFPNWRQQKVIFMNGGGGHEESVTWVLAEAERGMLVHCCCFVVNLVRGYSAARQAGLFYSKCVKVTSSAESETCAPPLLRIPGSTDIRVHRGELVVFFSFWEDVLTFLSKLHKFSRWHFGARRQVCVWVVSFFCLIRVYESWCWLCGLFQSRRHVLCEKHNTMCGAQCRKEIINVFGGFYFYFRNVF